MFTYNDYRNEATIKLNEEFKIYGMSYEVERLGNHYYLRSKCGNNDRIFKKLNIDKNQFFKEVLNENYRLANADGLSPYAYSLEDITKIIGKLWEYTPFKPGDRVRVKSNLKENETYNSISFVLSMKEHCGKIFKIRSSDIIICSGTIAEGAYIVYRLDGDGGWMWSYDMLEKVEEEEKVPEDKYEHKITYNHPKEDKNKTNAEKCCIKLPTIKKLKIVL